MTQYLDSRFTTNPRTRAVQACWHDVVTAVVRAERVFREIGDTREADQVSAYGNLGAQYALRHLDRIANSNGNGHHTDSTPATEQGPVTANETVTCVDCNRGEVVPPDASPVVAVPSNDVEGRIQTMIAQLEDLMVKHRDHQPYEVALKILNRGRTILRSGTDDRGRPLTRERKEELAERQLRAAFNAAGEAKAMEI